MISSHLYKIEEPLTNVVRPGSYISRLGRLFWGLVSGDKALNEGNAGSVRGVNDVEY